MDYKLIAIDLDDTLLDDNKNITEENFKAIRRAQEAGVHISIATGRAKDGMVKVKSDLGLNGYSIVIGGAQILDNANNPAYACYLPVQSAKNVMAYLMERDIYFQIYLSDENFYYLKRTPHSAAYEKKCGYHGYESSHFLSLEAPEVTKILAVTENGNEYTLRDEMRNAFPELNIVISYSGYVELINKEVSKGSALLKLAAMLDIPREQTIAIGDSNIDASMIEAAGLGVAMANARDGVESIANYVTCADSNHSGVAEVINKFIFGE